MKVTKNISAMELLPQSVWQKWGAGALRLVDERIVEANQKIRERFGKPRFFNTWAFGGDRDESGLRTPGQKYFSPRSQHTFGRALDSISDFTPHEEVWEDVLDHPEWYWGAGVSVVESIRVASSWLHTDCRGYGYDGRRITELMILDKVNGAWVLVPAREWRAQYAEDDV